MIDFNSTHDSKGLIHYCNEYGETLKTYKMSELEKYVIDAELNQTPISANGRSQLDPECIDGLEVIEPIEYINENWEAVTKAFYIDRNPLEFKSNNLIQQTRKAV